jgi:lambda family phage tail tape measure protein
MSEEGQNSGTARIDVVVNTDRMDAAVESAKTRISGMSAQAQADYAALSAAQKRATDSALTQADAIGKSREEMTLYKASLKGLPVSILDELKTKIVASQVAANEASVAIAAMGSGLGKSSLSDSALFKINRSISAYKEQAIAIQLASDAEANDALKRSSFSDANIFRLNQTIAKYKEQSSAIQSAAEIDSKAMLDRASLNNAGLLRINQSLAAYKQQSAAQADLAAQTAVEDQARIEQEVRWQAFLRESAAEKIGINEAVATSNVQASASAGTDAAAFNAAVLRKNAALTELNTAMAAGIPDIAALTEANVQLDVAMAAGALSAREQQAYITTLNAAEERLTGVKIGETVATEANTVATNANTVAKGMNSRVAYSASALISDAASGQFGRSKRELAALANETGLLSKLFTPVGVAIGATAAAVGLLGVAAYKAADAQTALEQAITRSGNAAGLDAEQVKQLATQYATYYTSAKQVIGIQEELMASGAVTASTFKQATQAAVVFGEATGESNKQVIQTFAEIAKNPLQTLDKINQVYGTITPQIRDHVIALIDEGDKLGAVAAAYQAIIDTMGHTAALEHEQEGLIDRLVARWKNGASAIGDAYAKLVNGLSLTDEFQLAKSTYEAHLKSTERNSPLDRFGGQVFSNNELQAEHDKVQALADAIQKTRDTAALGGQTTEDNKAGNAANSYYDAHFAKLDKIKEKQKEINDLTANYEQMWEHTAGSNARLKGVQRVLDENGKASFVGGNYDRDLAGINAKFKGKSGKSAADPFNASIVDAGLDETKQVDKDIEAYKKEADQWAKSTATAVAYNQTLRDMLDTRKRAIDLQVESVGMGAKEIQQQSALIAIDQDYDTKKAELQRRQQSSTSALERDGYQKQLDDLAKYHDDRIKMELDGWRREADARQNAMLGAQAALADFTDSAKDVAGQTKSIFGNAFDGMASALANFVSTGKLNFSSLATSIISDLAKMEARILISQALQSMFGGFGGTNGQGGTTTNAQGFVNHVYANGDAFNGSPGLSAYSNSVVDKPTFFANGGNVMGEAGPEAIMPLSRGSNGKLGVQASGGGAEVVINITNQGQPVQAKQTGMRNDGGKVIIDLMLQAVASDIATGGKTAKAMQGRYGLQQRGVAVGG